MNVGRFSGAYQQASGTWRGCDWPTRFSRSTLDLNGLKAAQAMLMARATSGGEGADWRAAAHWLTEVEQDAMKAEEEARTAATLADEGELDEALTHARRACTLESKYHGHLVWQPLCDCIEAAQTEA
jgi:hypothetical protein